MPNLQLADNEKISSFQSDAKGETVAVSIRNFLDNSSMIYLYKLVNDLWELDEIKMVEGILITGKLFLTSDGKTIYVESITKEIYKIEIGSKPTNPVLINLPKSFSVELISPDGSMFAGITHEGVPQFHFYRLKDNYSKIMSPFQYLSSISFDKCSKDGNSIYVSLIKECGTGTKLYRLHFESDESEFIANLEFISIDE